MNYKVEALPGEPVILATLYEDYSYTVDDPQANAEVVNILDEIDGAMFLVIDATHRSFSLDDVVQAANNDARGEDALYHHPKLLGVLIVTRSSLVRLATKGLNTVTFGNVNAYAFEALDEAIEYARSQILP